MKAEETKENEKEAANFFIECMKGTIKMVLEDKQTFKGLQNLFKTESKGKILLVSAEELAAMVSRGSV